MPWGALLELEGLGAQVEGYDEGQVIAQSWIVHNAGRGSAWHVRGTLTLEDGRVFPSVPAQTRVIAGRATPGTLYRSDFKFVVPTAGLPTFQRTGPPNPEEPYIPVTAKIRFDYEDAVGGGHFETPAPPRDEGAEG